MRDYPSKIMYNKSFCEKLIEHMKKGLSAHSFGAVVGCGKSTVFTWINRHEEFAHAYEYGRSLSLLYYERLKSAGSSGIEVRTEDGKKLKPNYNFVQFSLSRGWREEYSEKTIVEHQGGTADRLVIDMGEDKTQKEDNKGEEDGGTSTKKEEEKKERTQETKEEVKS